MLRQAVCKNTFISFVGDPDDVSDASLMSSPKVTRSRSAESARCRPEADEFQELTQQSLQRLNAVLSVGMSSPHKNSGSFSEVGEPPSSPVVEPFKTEESVGLSELRMLQEKLGKALSASSPPHSPLQKPWDKQLRIASNCSLSTMAPDDASDVASLPGDLPSMPGLGGLRRMPHVWSSGSVSTMVSDLDFVDEDGEVEFELDIEAGAEAAINKAARVPWAAMGEGSADATRDDANAPSKLTPEMSHGQVPKNQNMEEMFASNKDEPITTVMIRNIPGRYSQNDLMLDLKGLGFAGTYDFLYMPMDKGTAANVGYAFVNFVEASWAQKCLQSFGTFRFLRHQRSSNKLASVSVAHLQGLEKNLQHYENAAVNHSKEKRRRPVVVANIAKMF